MKTLFILLLINNIFADSFATKSLVLKCADQFSQILEIESDPSIPVLQTRSIDVKYYRSFQGEKFRSSTGFHYEGLVKKSDNSLLNESQDRLETSVEREECNNGEIKKTYIHQSAMLFLCDLDTNGQKIIFAHGSRLQQIKTYDITEECLQRRGSRKRI